MIKKLLLFQSQVDVKFLVSLRLYEPNYIAQRRKIRHYIDDTTLRSGLVVHVLYGQSNS